MATRTGLGVHEENPQLAWAAGLLTLVVAGLAWLVAGPDAAEIFALAATAGAVMTAISRDHHFALPRRSLVLLCAAAAMMLIETLIWMPASLAAAGVGFVANVLMVSAAMSVAKHLYGHEFRSRRVDLLIVAAAGVLTAVVLNSLIAPGSFAPDARLMVWLDATYWPAAAIVIAVLAFIVAEGRLVDVAGWGLLGAALGNGAGDGLFLYANVGVLNESWALGAATGCYVVGNALLAFAVLHPTFGALARTQLATRPALRLTVVAAVCGAVLVAVGVIPSATGGERVVRGVLVAAILLLLVWRVARIEHDFGEARVELEAAAVTDPLTHVGNRRSISSSRVSQIRAEISERQRLAAVFIVSLHHFERVRLLSTAARSSESAEAMVLTRAAQLLARQARVMVGDAGIHLVRMREGTFAVLGSVPSASLASEVAQSLRVVLLQEAFDVDGHEPLRFGAFVSHHAEEESGSTSFAELLRCAEIAHRDLARTHSDGGQSVAGYSHDRHDYAVRLAHYENELLSPAITEKLRLEFQPIVSMIHPSVASLEALIRWRDPQLGDVSPADFIPIAERCGAIHSIGAWVLREALRHHRDWVESGVISQFTTISVNVSPAQLADPQRFLRCLDQLADVVADPAIRLRLELTENSLQTQRESAREVMRRSQQDRWTWALDDVGASEHGLKAITDNAPGVSVIKFDASMVPQLMDVPRRRTLTRLIQTATDRHLTTVMEGVADDDPESLLLQLQVLRSIGFHEIQGFGIHPPVPAADVPAMMARVADRNAQWGALWADDHVSMSATQSRRPLLGD